VRHGDVANSTHVGREMIDLVHSLSCL
jgi:hypothetical protein